MAETSPEYEKMLSEIDIDKIKIKGCLKEGTKGIFSEHKNVPDASTILRPENVSRNGAKELKEILGEIY